MGIGHPLALQAARWLLEALATPAAIAVAERLPREERIVLEWPTTVRVEAATGIIRWDHAVASAWPRSKATPLTAARELKAYALDPDLLLAPSDIDVLRGLAAASEAGRVGLGDETAFHDLALEDAGKALARGAPDALGGVVRRVFATAAGRALQKLERLARKVPEHLLVVDELGREAIAGAADRLIVGDEARAGWSSSMSRSTSRSDRQIWRRSTRTTRATPSLAPIRPASPSTAHPPHRGFARA